MKTVPEYRFTPVKTVLRAVISFLEDDSLTGQVAECSVDQIYYRDQIPYSDETAEWIGNGGVGELIMMGRKEGNAKAQFLMNQ